MKCNKKLLLIELNEINFDLVKVYLEKYKNRFLGIQNLLRTHEIITESEVDYENLEPWIQWVSAHTGLSYVEHGIFRLGDGICLGGKQIFEAVERQGYKVGAISPMNAVNSLKDPAYFIPDPWTRTNADDSWLSKGLAQAVSQAVNDNSSSRISVRSALYLGIGLIIFSNKKRLIKYLKLACGSMGRPWRKALFLDLFLHDLHLSLLKQKPPNFSTLFLNAGAHIQHHYLFNSLMDADEKFSNPAWYISPNDDPFLEMLDVYDCIISDYLKIRDYELIVATGLSQILYDRIKYYYRLKDHKNFLSLLGVECLEVSPRMTRDFLIGFKSQSDALRALEILDKLEVDDNEKLFGRIELRERELFVTLTYSREINRSTQIKVGVLPINLYDHVSFVAIKNGMHQAKGFLYCSNVMKTFFQSKAINIKDLSRAIKNYFSEG